MTGQRKAPTYRGDSFILVRLATGLLAEKDQGEDRGDDQRDISADGARDDRDDRVALRVFIQGDHGIAEEEGDEGGEGADECDEPVSDDDRDTGGDASSIRGSDECADAKDLGEEQEEACKGKTEDLADENEDLLCFCHAVSLYQSTKMQIETFASFLFRDPRLL